MVELGKPLAALEREQSKKIKNMVSGSGIEAAGNVHIGDKGVQGREELR